MLPLTAHQGIALNILVIASCLAHRYNPVIRAMLLGMPFHIFHGLLCTYIGPLSCLSILRSKLSVNQSS